MHHRGWQLCAIVTFSVSGHDCESVGRARSEAGIKVSVTLASSAQLDLPRRGQMELVRASVHYYNTDKELDRMVAALPSPSRGH